MINVHQGYDGQSNPVIVPESAGSIEAKQLAVRNTLNESLTWTGIVVHASSTVYHMIATRQYRFI